MPLPGRFKAALPSASVASALPLLYDHWNAALGLMVRLLVNGAVEAALASGANVAPVWTVTGIPMAPAGPPASVAPEWTCMAAPAGPLSMPPTLSVPALTLITGLLAPESDVAPPKTTLPR